MTATVNQQIRLASRPVGAATADNWRLTDDAVPAPGAGQVLVRVLLLSLDPAMRGWMNEGRSYIAPVGIDEVMRAGGVGRVVESKDPAFAVGDAVSGLFGVQEFACLPAKALEKMKKAMQLEQGTPLRLPSPAAA